MKRKNFAWKLFHKKDPIKAQTVKDVSDEKDPILSYAEFEKQYLTNTRFKPIIGWAALLALCGIWRVLILILMAIENQNKRR